MTPSRAPLLCVGELQLDAVIDGTGSFPPTKSYFGTTELDWAPHADLLNPRGRLEFTVGGLLVRGLGHTILVDLGLGPRTFFGMRGGAFLDELTALGVQPAEVTDVLFTHLHYDHIGWAATSDGEPVFGQATYRCASADWKHFIDQNPAGDEARVLAPIRDRFAFWDEPGTLLPGVHASPTPGHTPGSTVLTLSSGPDRAVLLGDVAHSPVELLEDRWHGLGDVEPEAAQQARNGLSAELAASGVPVVGAHFPELRFGLVRPGEPSRMWEPRRPD